MADSLFPLIRSPLVSYSLKLHMYNYFCMLLLTPAWVCSICLLAIPQLGSAMFLILSMYVPHCLLVSFTKDFIEKLTMLLGVLVQHMQH